MKYRIKPEIPARIPRYPIYIISKGRAYSPQTAKALDEMKCPYRMVIEPQEYEEYSKVIDPKKLLVLPFSNLGLGGITARNWVWEHSISEGHERHWILDDNIQGFKRVHKNLRYHVKTGAIFRAHEDFVDRYDNIKMSGFNYTTFVMAVTEYPPYYINSRIYSCILLSNDVYEPSKDHTSMGTRYGSTEVKSGVIRWIPRFNEDTKLSLDMMKRGYCTILTNNFTASKTVTLTMKGGNTEEIYGDTNNRLEFAQELRDAHPDVVQITKKYGRWHHHVEYSRFQKVVDLKLKPEYENIPADYEDEYGMELMIKNPNDVDLTKYVYNRYTITED